MTRSGWPGTWVLAGVLPIGLGLYWLGRLHGERIPSSRILDRAAMDTSIENPAAVSIGLRLKSDMPESGRVETNVVTPLQSEADSILAESPSESLPEPDHESEPKPLDAEVDAVHAALFRDQVIRFEESTDPPLQLVDDLAHSAVTVIMDVRGDWVPLSSDVGFEDGYNNFMRKRRRAYWYSYGEYPEVHEIILFIDAAHSLRGRPPAFTELNGHEECSLAIGALIHRAEVALESRGL